MLQFGCNLVYLKYWTLNLMPLMVYLKILVRIDIHRHNQCLASGVPQAPKWVFPAESSQLTGTSAPLYIGSLPSRPAEHCTALLPVRPASLPKGLLAVLALTLASREPHFTLVMHGEPVLTRCDYTAVFHSLLLLIQCGKLENYGMIGANLSLDYLGLAQVVQPADRILDSFRGFWQLWLRQ